MNHPFRIIAKKLLIVLVLYLICQGSAFPQEATRKSSLKNGITVLIRENHSVPVVSFFVVYRVGSRNEQLGTTGISHQLEHMLFRGTEKFPPGKIGRTLDVLGADYNAFTTYDITGYYETLPAEYLPTAMEIEADRMVNSKLDASVLKQEKTVVLSELEGDENSPAEILYNEVEEAHFAAHPYHWPVGGFKNDVRKLEREDVYSYYKAYYSPRNAIICIVGDVETGRTMELLEKYFGSIPPGNPVPSVRSEEPPQISEKRVVIKEKGKTSYIEVAFHTPSIKDPDIYALAVTDAILAEGRSSRLYRALVDNGLATGISSNLWENCDPGMYSIVITLAPGKKHQEVEDALFEEIGKFSSSKISEREMQKAVNGVKAGFFRAKDSFTLLAEYLAWYEAIYSYKFLDGYLDNIRKVKDSDVNQAAKKYLKKSACTIGWYCALPEKQEEGAIPSRYPVSLAGSKCTAAPGAKIRYAGNGAPFSHRNNFETGGALIAGRTPPSGSSPNSADAGSQKGSWSFSFSRFTLPNGLTVIVKENHSNPTVTVSGYVKAGSVFDPPGKEGLSYFTASMLDRGAGAMSFQEMAEELDFLGATLSFTGSREVTEINGWTLPEHLDRVIEVLSVCLANPSFPAEEYVKVTREITSELHRQFDDPQSRALIALREMMYPAGHPYHANIKGYEESLGNIRIDDIRSFHRKYYSPADTVLVFVGDVKPDEIKARIEKFFGAWKGEEAPPALTIPSVSMPDAPRKKILTMEGKHQVAVVMGNIGISRNDRDYYAFDLLNNILGGNTLTSRLGTVLREKEGLVYGIWAYTMATKGDSPWMIIYETNGKDVAKSLASVNEVVREIQSKPPSDEEIADAKSTLINQIAVSMETNGKVAGILCDMEYFNLGEDYVKNISRLYSSVTKEDLLRVAKSHIHLDRGCLVIAGPYKE